METDGVRNYLEESLEGNLDLSASEASHVVQETDCSCLVVAPSHPYPYLKVVVVGH